MTKVAYLLCSTTILSGIILSSNIVSADDVSVVDQASITVPVACTLHGTGTDSHNAVINNGQYNSAIGETTVKATCNDSNGFSIYAIGFTDDTPTKNVLTNSALGSTYNIETGTGTSGATSQWAMKLSTVTSPEPTYPITIQNNFATFQEVPDEYTLVAQRTSGTDSGATSEGSLFKTTYQVYISPTQPAGTYTGQVKYRLIHPYNATTPTTTFTVFYTGRPISNEPGQENPVVIDMADVGVGEYNLLGSTEGGYDKLTPDTLYGGYYKNVVNSLSDFQYTNESDVYDGTNFDWMVAEPETTDAAHIIPEEDAIYYVKEVANENFLKLSLRWTASYNTIKDIFFVTALDDENYTTAGFDVSANNIDYSFSADMIVQTYHITATSTGSVSTYTASSLFRLNGDNNVLAAWKDRDRIFMNDETESLTSVQYWCTVDGYKVTPPRLRTINSNGWYSNAVTASTETIPATITRVSPCI